MGLHQAALKIRSRILADRLNRFLQLGSNEGITVLINRITILLVILIETFQNGFNLGINVLHTAFVRLDRGQIIVQQLTLNQVEGQNAANPAILHFHILAAFFLDDHVRVHGSYRIEFSRLVSIDEIRANDYNLNIPRYVDSSENAETWDMYASMFGGVPKSEVEQLGEYWNVWPSLKAELFRDNGACYACDHDDVATVVRNNADVQTFVASYAQAISGLPSDLRFRLVEHPEQVDALGQETAIGEELDAMVADTALIDPYDAYQKLDDAWGGISIDLEVLGSEGFDAVRAVDPNMVIKKKGGKDVEVQDGWIGRVLPFDLVQRELLHDDLAAIEADERRVQDIDSEIETILEGFDEDDKQNSDAINQDGDAFVAAELKKAVKAIGKTPVSDFERGLVQAQKLFDEAKKLKSGIKTKRNALEEKTCDAIKVLSDDEARRLLEAKWITPLQKQLEALPNAVIDEFIGKVNALKNKYATTYADVCGQIDEAEKELAGMLGDLTGNARDMAGLEELKALLGGE